MNKREFTAFVEQYERLVYTICFQFTREAHAAQDLTQDTFLSAYLHMDACPKGYERQWLGRIATNKCKDHLQSAWSRHVDLPGDEGMPPGLSPPAEEVALQKLRAADAKEAIRGFPEPYGAVLRLCLLEERSAEEAAAALGRPVKTVYTQLNRGKKLLREQLERRRDHV
ncbi:MAG: RNA polymerase sigma factor [Oscillibacter sp.]|nr:RNA polymerase sigma factor [Oscillibacter sp.]